MEYTVHKLAKLAGVTARTLRYYDQIDLLKPARIHTNGYRIYGFDEVKRLQQILFYRELDVSLDQIKQILSGTGFSQEQALAEHYQRLLEKRAQIDLLIANVETSISVCKGEMKMSDQDRFEGFKKALIEENEKKYGREIRERYGDELVESSYDQIRGMSPADQGRLEQLEKELNQTLKAAVLTGDPNSEEAYRACDLHKQWLSFYWKEYNKDAHQGIAQMYVEDPRFTEYYEKIVPGCAAFLYEAVKCYIEASV